MGVPVVKAPNIGGLTEASNAAGAAAQQATTPTQSNGNAQPSIIIVEVLGFGGGSADEPASQEEQHRRRDGANEQRSQTPDSAYQVLGAGEMTADEARQIIAERRHRSGR